MEAALAIRRMPPAICNGIHVSVSVRRNDAVIDAFPVESVFQVRRDEPN
jgi:hypothetical protein